jgi:DHA2 family multidrug resistance protein
MIPWEMNHRNPMIDLRMVATRRFGASFVVMLATGAILLATTQFLPQLVQQNFGYTATWAGLLLSPGGIVTMVMMFVVLQPADRVHRAALPARATDRLNGRFSRP